MQEQVALKQVTVPVHITSHNFVIFMGPAVRTSCLRDHSNQCGKF
jgi:hypothetical protein